MVSYKVLSFYHEISQALAEFAMELEALRRMYFFSNLELPDQLEKFNESADQAKENGYEQMSEWINQSDKLPVVSIEIPNFTDDEFYTMLEKSMIVLGFSYFEKYMFKILNFVMDQDPKYKNQKSKARDDEFYKIFNGNANKRINKIKAIIGSNYKYDDRLMNDLDKYVRIRNLFVHHDGIVNKGFQIILHLDDHKFPVGSVYSSNQSYMDLLILDKFLRAFDAEVVKLHPLLPRYQN